jgi:hypothetical protein
MKFPGEILLSASLPDLFEKHLVIWETNHAGTNMTFVA